MIRINMIKSSICRERHCIYFSHKENCRPMCKKTGNELDIPNDDSCEDELFDYFHTIDE